jgi:hypothetical protein
MLRDAGISGCLFQDSVSSHPEKRMSDARALTRGFEPFQEQQQDCRDGFGCDLTVSADVNFLYGHRLFFRLLDC